MKCDKLDIDKLLQIFCEGIYAMDPKTTLPFWDYDFAPIFGDLWIKKMLKAAKTVREKKVSFQEISDLFENIAVPRKEIIYSLVDLKVGKVPKEDRLFYVNFWWNVILEKCQRDCLVEKSNIVHTDRQIKEYLDDLSWEQADREKSRQIGNLAMMLNSLAYGLYTDIFAHNSMENFGAYDVSKYFNGKKYIMVIKQWANLRPVELFPEFKNFPFDKLNIFAIYKNIDFTVDIYTHQVYSGNAAENLVKYSVSSDSRNFLNEAEKLEKLNEYLGKIVSDHFAKSQKRGFGGAKRIWVLARNYQFKKFFELVGLDWYDQKILNRIKGKKLLKTDYWDFDKYPKEILFKFWKKCFDPRLDTFYEDWGKILKETIDERT